MNLLYGQRVGNWIVLEEVDKRSNGERRWKCSCTSCGETSKRPKYQIKTGRKGCHSCYSKTTRGDPADYAWGYLTKRYQQGAKNRGLSWNLTPETVKVICSQDCHYCGTIPHTYKTAMTAALRGRSGSTEDPHYAAMLIKTNGIDRKDNTLGYIENNVVPCCTQCNMMKGSFSYEEFTDWIKSIIKFNLQPPQ